MNTEKRDYTWDIVRGIGILMVVVGHCGPSQLAHFVYLFHMGLFFFVSGNFMKIKVGGQFAKNVEGYIVRKLKSLWIPFVIFTLFILCLQDFFVDHAMAFTRYPGKEFVKTALMVLAFKQVDNPMLCPIWFLKSLFFCSIFVYVVLLAIKGTKLRYAFFAILYVITIVLPYAPISIPSVILREMTVSCIIFMGYAMHQHHIIERKFINRKSLMFSFVVLLVASFYIKIDVMTATFSYPLVFPVMTFTGIVFTYNMSVVLMKTFKKLSLMLSYFGEHSLYILLLHVMGFKFLSVFLVRHYALKTTPPTNNLYNMVINENVGCCWWLVYTIVGISFSLLVMYAVRMIKSKLKINI